MVPGAGGPHETMLKEHFPVFYTRCSALLPRSYPASNVANKLRERKIQAPARLRQLHHQSLMEERDKERRLVAVARARQDARRARNSAVATSSSGVVTLAKARQLTDTTGKRWSCGTQTRPAPVRTLSSQTPRRRLVDACMGPGVPMDYLPNFAAMRHGAPSPAPAREGTAQPEESLVSGPSDDSAVRAEESGVSSQAPGTPDTSPPAAQLPVTPRTQSTPERPGLRRSGRKRQFRFDPATIFSPQAEKKRKGILKTPNKDPAMAAAAAPGGGAGTSGTAPHTPQGAGRSRSATLYQLRVAMLRKSRSSVAPKSFRGTRVLRTVYEVQVDGRMKLVTREEYQAMFPGERVPALSAMAKQNRSVIARLRRRLSRRYRDQRQAYEDRYRMKAKHVKGADYAIPAVRLTNTMSCLLDRFFDSVIKCGPAALPVQIDELDPENSDDEFFEQVVLSRPIRDDIVPDDGDLDLFTGPMELSEGVIAMIEDSPQGVLRRTPMAVRTLVHRESVIPPPPRSAGRPRKLAKVFCTKRAPQGPMSKPGVRVVGESTAVCDDDNDDVLATPLVALEDEMTHL